MTRSYTLEAFEATREQLESALLGAFQEVAADWGDRVCLLDWFTVNADFHIAVEQAKQAELAPAEQAA
ncbi:hypothetical protein [Rubrivirga sp.]|uniref:hypothetical protein n=1 Tax=Rubrivirga sp. TaxID=1885344 RepID=UPI003B52DBB4